MAPCSLSSISSTLNLDEKPNIRLLGTQSRLILKLIAARLVPVFTRALIDGGLPIPDGLTRILETPLGQEKMHPLQNCPWKFRKPF